MVNPLVPPAITAGDTIAIVAPSGQIHDISRFDAGVRVLKEMGFNVRFPKNLWPGSGYFADTDKNRADEFNRAWADSEVKAIIAARGGFGCLRILPQIDLNQIFKKPKLFIGFSDITVFHSFFQQRTGLVGFHAPVLTSLGSSSKESIERLFYSLTGYWTKKIVWKKIEVLRSGPPVEGILTGGNLSSIMSLIGTPFQPDWQEKIVFLEDTAEPFYRLDRMMTQLYHAGLLKNIKGLILGDFSLGNHQDPLENLRHHETLWKRALELTSGNHIPVWGGFPVGHCLNNLSLPVGASAIMNSEKATLQFF
jgi:muramoyltetrapeptide carboxypeptidase